MHQRVWTVDESGLMGALVFFGNPEVDFTDGLGFTANVNVIVEPIQGLDLKDYVEAGKEVLPTLFTGDEPVEDTDGTVGGLQAHLLGATFVQGAYGLRNRQLIIVKPGKAYIVTATALEESWDKYEDIFDASLRTFGFD